MKINQQYIYYYRGLCAGPVPPYSIWHRNTAPHCNFLRKEPGPSPGGSFLLAPLGAQSRRQFLSSSAGPSPGDIIPAGLQALLSIEAGANVL